MALESSAYFKERAKVVGISDTTFALILEAGWSNMGSFAFACPQAPGGGDDAAFTRDVITPILGSEPDRGAIASLRRLFFEAYTFVVQDMRTRVDRSEDDPPRKLPRVEHQDRVAAVRSRLPGARLSDEREPGKSVVDAFAQMSEDGPLRYLPWNRIVSLRHEQTHGRTTKEWKPNKSGQITEKVTRETPAQETSTLFKLDSMLARRGVALEAARLLSYEAHQRLADRLFRALEDEPADPTLYDSTSLAQAAKADEYIFHQLSKRCTDGIARLPSGVYPLEAPLQELLDGVGFHHLLTPLPKARHSSSSGSGADPKLADPKRAARKMQQQLAASAKAPQPKAGPAPNPKSGKGNGKNKKHAVPRMPLELVGMAFMTPAGAKLCYDFNMAGCSGASPGGTCTKGFHGCCRFLQGGDPCLAPHSQRDHPS
jgi:hypothetical protein